MKSGWWEFGRRDGSIKQQTVEVVNVNGKSIVFINAPKITKKLARRALRSNEWWWRRVTVPDWLISQDEMAHLPPPPIEDQS